MRQLMVNLLTGIVSSVLAAFLVKDLESRDFRRFFFAFERVFVVCFKFTGTALEVFFETFLYTIYTVIALSVLTILQIPPLVWDIIRQRLNPEDMEAGLGDIGEKYLLERHQMSASKAALRHYRRTLGFYLRYGLLFCGRLFQRRRT